MKTSDDTNCSVWKSRKKLIMGLLLLLNAWIWPRWVGIDGWITWLAVLMTLFGLLGSFKTGWCSRGSSKVSSKKSVKKRKKR